MLACSLMHRSRQQPFALLVSHLNMSDSNLDDPILFYNRIQSYGLLCPVLFPNDPFFKNPWSFCPIYRLILSFSAFNIHCFSNILFLYRSFDHEPQQILQYSTIENYMYLKIDYMYTKMTICQLISIEATRLKVELQEWT